MQKSTNQTETFKNCQNVRWVFKKLTKKFKNLFIKPKIIKSNEMFRTSGSSPRVKLSGTIKPVPGPAEDRTESVHHRSQWPHRFGF